MWKVFKTDSYRSKSISYYRKFIRNFAHHSVPLHALKEKNAHSEWTFQCQDAFTYLKHALTNPPVVAFPAFTLPFFFYTDASCSAIGAVLSQRQGYQEKMIAYASHVLTKAERKWSAYDRELWAIVWAVRHFHHYLYKQPFVIVTDHKPLLGLRKIPIDNDRTGCRARWALERDPFEWTVVPQRWLPPPQCRCNVTSPCWHQTNRAEHLLQCSG